MSADRRLLVTGAGGFLGRRVVEEFRSAGWSSIFTPSRHDCDLTTDEGIRCALDLAKPDVVVHIAAVVGGIGANMASPGTFFYANAFMGIQLMEMSRRAGVGKFVQVGTVCSYPNFAPVPFREEDIWNGYPEETNAPYGLAKKMLLVQAQAYRQEFGFNAIYLIPVNLYGPADNFDLKTSHVVPALIHRFSEAKRWERSEVVCWGTGGATREFLYVDDAARGIRLATETYDGAEPVNLGTGSEISIKDLAERVACIVGYEGRITWDDSKPDGQPRRRLDTTRAASLFGFRACTPLDDGLREAVRWYEEHLADADPREHPRGP